MPLVPALRLAPAPAAAASLAALAFLPGWSFYYDVTPKAAIVLVAAILASIHMIVTPQTTRWNTILASAFAVSALLSTALSPHLSLAMFGSNWRRTGTAMVVALLLIAIAAGGRPHLQGRMYRQWMLGAVCAAGVVSGTYAIAQYFGWDPFLDAQGYHFGEGEYQIVRPPGTMGHANYLSAFLLWPAFFGVEIWRVSNKWRFLGLAASLVSVAAILLSGSRGAWAGVLAGILVVFVSSRPSWKQVGILAAVAIVIAGIFYASPAGERLRARVFWMGEDAAGGSRLMLWRDSLQMSAERPLLGYGPEAFVAEFPLHQSAELSRAYPSFFHESPHNMFLDVLTGQGLLGLGILSLWIFLSLRRGWRADPVIAAALVAAIVAHQFAVLVIPTALLFFLTMGLLLEGDTVTIPLPGRWLLAPAALALGLLAIRMIAADVSLARVKNALDRGDPVLAADLWAFGVRDVGVSADLYFSRRWAGAAAEAAGTLDKLRFAQVAGNAAAAATRWPEQRQNAFYNLAQVQAAANNNAAVEASLRGAIASSPNWYKPHWALARLLALEGWKEQARSEARLALDLNGGHDGEVAETLQEIVRSRHAPH